MVSDVIDRSLEFHNRLFFQPLWSHTVKLKFNISKLIISNLLSRYSRVRTQAL